ncbi:MAG: tail fiber domain-containing protein [Saprospiraceae bacterium]|nr:tail fiber domain-containing protein [Saprospiraceae bacterium]
MKVKWVLSLMVIVLPFIGNSQISISDDLNPGASNSDPQELLVFDNRLFFTAAENSERSIYEYNSLNNQTNELSVPTGNFDPRELTILNGKLYFSGETSSGRYLYELSPNSSTPVMVGNLAYDPVEFIEYNGYIYFVGGNTLYSYDGISSVVNLATLPNGFINRNIGNVEQPYSEKSIRVVNNNLVFHGFDGLYSYSIQNNSITLVCPVPSDLGGVDYNLGVLDNYVLYSSSNSYSIPNELVIVDFSSVSPTYNINSLNTNSTFSFPRHFINYDNKIFFIAGVSNPYNATLHFFDSNGSIHEVINSPISGSFGGSYDDPLKIISNVLYFENQRINGPAPYSIDNSSCFTLPYFERNAILRNGKIHYVGLDNSTGFFQLFACDGTSIDTITCLVGFENTLSNLTYYNNEIYFIALFVENYGAEVFATTSDGSGFCNNDSISEIPCIEMIGKVKITNTVPAIGNYSILTHNSDGLVSSIPVSSLNVDDADSDPLNELQLISLNGLELSLSENGGTVILPAGGDDLGNHFANQNLDLNGNKIINLPAPINASDAVNKAYVDALSINDADSDPLNEIQSLSILGSNLTLSGSNTILLPLGLSNLIEDSDQDTYINVESTPDLDKINVGLSGMLGLEIRRQNNNVIFDIKNSSNTIFGGNAGLNLLSTSVNSTFIGKNAGNLVSNSSNNTFIGQNAGQNVNNSENLGIGVGVFGNSTSVWRSVGIGNGCLANNNGVFNVGLGRAAGNLSTGSSNTYLGDQCGINQTTGGGNTFVGRNAGYQMQSGDYNVAIGFDAGATSSFSNISNSIAIGHTARPTSSNQVIIGNTSTQEICGYVDFSVCSDIRIKNNVLENVSGLPFIKKLRPVSYNIDYQKISSLLNEDSDISATDRSLLDSRNQKSLGVEYGFIAQEVEQAANDLGVKFQAVHKPKERDGLYRLSYSTFVVPLVKAVQELDEQNNELKLENEKLKKSLDIILLRLDELEKGKKF